MTASKQELTRPAPSSERIAPPLAGAAARPARKPPRILRRMLALDDFEDAARRVIPRPIFGYVAGGAETNASRRANRDVWDEIAFVPKTLVDSSGRAQKTTLFGQPYDAPFGIAPMGGPNLHFPKRDDGDLARRLSEAQKAAAKLEPHLIGQRELSALAARTHVPP